MSRFGSETVQCIYEKWCATTVFVNIIFFKSECSFVTCITQWGCVTFAKTLERFSMRQKKMTKCMAIVEDIDLSQYDDHFEVNRNRFFLSTCSCILFYLPWGFAPPPSPPYQFQNIGQSPPTTKMLIQTECCKSMSLRVIPSCKVEYSSN